MSQVKPAGAEAREGGSRTGVPVCAPAGRSPAPSLDGRTPTPAPAGLPFWKRSLDLALLVFALPFALPVSALLAAGIWLVSPGAILFRQERIGLRGRRFSMFKFRSMRLGASPAVHEDHFAGLMCSDQPMHKLDRKDGRLIPLGRLLRASGLDELPQLINVLRGEMSIVGPRPCTVREFERYEPWQWERFDILPGLTGLWQVSGKNKTTFREMIELDIAYARQQSLWLDLHITLRTFRVLWEQAAESVEAGSPEQRGRRDSLLETNSRQTKTTEVLNL